MLLAFIALYLLATLAIGYWASRRVKSTRDFVIAGRNMPLLVAGSALFATWFGSETIMGASSEFVENGVIGIIEDPFGAALCLILVGAFFARPLYRLNILTFNDYFRLRYNRTVEFLSAIFMVPSFFGWIAAQLVAMAIIFKTLTGLPLEYGVLLCTVIVVFYTYIGGMWAVSVTDFVQTIMIVLGMTILSIQLVNQAGGLETVINSQPKEFYRFWPERDLHSVVHYIAAWITIGLGSIPGQDMFQRVMSARDAKTSVRAAYLGGAMYLTIALFPLLIGLCSFVLYPELLEGDSQMVLISTVQLHGSMAMKILFFGALLSAILSTASGAILAPATVIGENLIKPRFKKMTDAGLLRTMRWSVVGVALASAAMAIWQQNIFDLVAQSSTLSLVSLFVPLTLGLYWKRASTFGAMLSITVGMGVWIVFEFIVPGEIPALIWGLLGSLGAMVVGSLVSGEKVKK